MDPGQLSIRKDFLRDKVMRRQETDCQVILFPADFRNKRKNVFVGKLQFKVIFRSDLKSADPPSRGSFSHDPAQHDSGLSALHTLKDRHRQTGIGRIFREEPDLLRDPCQEFARMPKKKEIHIRSFRIEMFKKSQKRHLGAAELHGVGDDQYLHFLILHALTPNSEAAFPQAAAHTRHPHRSSA